MNHNCERCDNPLRQHQRSEQGNIRFVWYCMTCGKEKSFGDGKDPRREQRM